MSDLCVCGADYPHYGPMTMDQAAAHAVANAKAFGLTFEEAAAGFAFVAGCLSGETR